MATFKIKNPSTGEIKTVTADHAAAIFKMQVDKGYPKSQCWKSAEKNPGTPANRKPDKKSEKVEKETKSESSE